MADLDAVARSKVHQAIRDGMLPRLAGAVLCVDCGKSARAYDHRDYKKPLDVAPVCTSCNVRRGRARNHPALLAEKGGDLYIRFVLRARLEPELVRFIREGARANDHHISQHIKAIIRRAMQEQDDDTRRPTNRVQPNLRRNRAASRGAGGLGTALPPTQGATD